MRKDLQSVKNQRTSFTAEFGRWGSRKDWNGVSALTVCFQNVKFSNGNLATDHIWFTVGKRIASLHLKPGMKIKFEARVKTYLKGYYMKQQSVDYKLSNPTKFEVS